MQLNMLVSLLGERRMKIFTIINAIYIICNLKMKRSLKKFFILYFAFAVGIVNLLKGQPMGVPIGSHPEYFTYFTPGSSAMPPNASVTSKSLILLQTTDLFFSEHIATSGSAFLIRTFRDDEKICACMSAHQLGLPFTSVVDSIARKQVQSDIYMNYLGRDNVVNDLHYNQLTRFDEGYMAAVSVRAYYFDPSTGRDIALVWINKNVLPSKSYSMLGYDFATGGWSNGRNYSMGHSLKYPQRLSDSLEMEWSSGDGSIVELKTKLPYAIGTAHSGSPVIQSLPNASEFVKGVVTQGDLHHDAPDNFGDNIDWATQITINSMSLLESAIRRDCWKKADSAQISVSQSYKQSLTIDNTKGIAPYDQNQSISSASAITYSAATETKKVAGVQESFLKANICGINGFTLPTAYPGGTDPWAVTVAAKEVNVSSDFNYEASGLSELNLASVVISTGTQSTARWVDSVQAGTAVAGEESSTRFDVYPNPSPEGIFNVKLPATGSFRLAIHDLDGKFIYGADCTGSPFRFALPAVARGSYLLTVYNKQHDELVYRKLIIY